jgi:TonB family protein
MRAHVITGVLLLVLIAEGGRAQVGGPAFHPAKLRDGRLPALPPPTVVGGGEAMIELDVTSAGAVRAAKALRTTPPYTAALIDATKAWRFTPAEIGNQNPTPPPGEAKWKAVDSTVLVAAVIRAPALIGPTLGETPRDVGSESDTTPFPFSTPAPQFPPRARDEGIVMIETTIDVRGEPTNNRVVRSSAAFDDAALAALRQWRFRPARILGATTPTLAYVIVGFRQPVLGAASPAPAPR